MLRLTSFQESMKGQDQQLLSARLKSLQSAFPFNEYEYTLMYLLDRKTITFRQYEALRSDYVSANRFLELYGLSPRVFGEIWGHQHIRDLDSRFVKPSVVLDPDYDGEYDLWLDGVKVEVKACRAINTKTRGNLVAKALHLSSRHPFWMNFQQIKPDAADVFIFVGVWADDIMYWVLSRTEVENNKYLSHQHRGGVEYQIGITDRNIAEFDRYRVDPSGIAQKVIHYARPKST